MYFIKEGVFLVFLLSSFFVVYGADITSCQNIQNGTHQLTQNISSNSTTCFSFNYSNTILDCQNYYIEGNSSNLAFELYDSTNITIKNCQVGGFLGFIIDTYNIHNSTYTNITSNGANTAVLIDSSSNITITNLTATNTILNSIELYDSSDLHLNNNTIYNSSKKGLFIQRVLISTFESLNISASGEEGVYYDAQSHNNNLSNSYVQHSDQSNASLPGLYVESSFGNLFYNNYFNNTLNINFSNTTSMWNTTYSCSEQSIIGGNCTGGNFWATYNNTGFSQLCSNETGGICSENYIMDENNTDYLALSIIDNAPTISLMTPSATYVNYSNVTFSCSVQDPYGLKNISLIINNTINQTQNTSGVNYIANFTQTINNTTWGCQACDQNDNCTSSSSQNMIYDSIEPEVVFNLSSLPENIYDFNYIYFFVNATDNNNITNVSTFVYNESALLQRNSSNTSFYINISNLFSGIYYVNATATDIADNKNLSLTRTYTIDLADPLVNITYPTNQSTINTNTFSVNYDVTDLTTTNCSLYINSSIENFENNLASGSQSLSATVSNGYYFANITCVDQVNRSATSNTVYFTVDKITSSSSSSSSSSGSSSGSSIRGVSPPFESPTKKIWYYVKENDVLEWDPQNKFVEKISSIARKDTNAIQMILTNSTYEHSNATVTGMINFTEIPYVTVEMLLPYAENISLYLYSKKWTRVNPMEISYKDNSTKLTFQITQPVHFAISSEEKKIQTFAPKIQNTSESIREEIIIVEKQLKEDYPSFQAFFSIILIVLTILTLFQV